MNNQKELILLEDLGMQYPTDKSLKKKRYGLYKCYCGNEFKTIVQGVKCGNTTSCGCYRSSRALESNTKHNLTHHRLYNTWKMMMHRCNNPKTINYKDYGARGIKVCDRWHNVSNFIEDMYPTFKDGLTLDRINPNGNYEISNCRWTTDAVQSRNTKKLQINNTSGYRGVHYNTAEKIWKAQIKVNSTTICLGRYDNPLECALIYDKYIIDNNLEHTKNF